MKNLSAIKISIVASLILLTSLMGSDVPNLEKQLGKTDGAKEIENTKEDNAKVVDDYINEVNSEDMQETENISSYPKVSLKDAIYEALSQSPSLKAQKEDVEKARLKLKDAKNDYLPKLDLEYSQELSRTDPSTDAAKSFDKSRLDTYKLTMTQNLYDGGVKDAVVNRRILELEQEMLAYKVKINDEIKKAIKAYLDVVYNKKSQDVNERNILLLEKVQEIISIKYESGGASLVDVTAVKAGVSSARANLEKVKSGYVDALKYYEFVMGTDFVKTFPIEENYEIKLSNLSDVYASALEQNPTVKSFVLDQKIAKEKIKESKGAFKPKVDFEASYERENEFNPTDEDYKPAKDLSGKVVMTYNIYNKGIDERNLLKSRGDIRKAGNKKDEEEKKLKWNLEKLYSSVSSTKTISANTQSEILSLRTMIKQYWEKFTTGEQDLQDLLNGQKQLNSAELEYIKYQSSLLQDFFNVLYYTGDLLTYFGIDTAESNFLIYDKGSLQLKTVNNTLNLQDPKNMTPVKSKLITYDIMKFFTDFIKSNDNNFTIQVKDFKSVYDIYAYLDAKKISNNYLIYANYEDGLIKHNLLLGVHSTRLAASNFARTKNINGNIITTKDAKPLLSSYQGEGIKVNRIAEITNTVVTKIQKETTIKKPVKYKMSDAMRDKFMDAENSNLSVYLGSFSTIAQAVTFAKDNAIFDNAFIYRTPRGTSFELMVGIFTSYTDAYAAASELKLNDGRGFLINRIEQAKSSYKLESEAIKEEKIDYELEVIETSEPVIASTDSKTETTDYIKREVK